VVSGQPSDALVPFRANTKPWWTVLLVLLGPWGWVLFLLLGTWLDHRVHGYLPYVDEIHTRARRSRRLALEVAVGAGGVTVGLAFALTRLRSGADLAVLLGGGLVVVAALGRAAVPAGTVTLRLDRSGRYVRLGSVHPAFVAAYRDQERRRVERRRREHAADAAGERTGCEARSAMEAMEPRMPTDPVGGA
jgi:hypothetical protein